MGPAAVDDEARSCLPAASQALSPDCAGHPCYKSWVWLAQALEEALEQQAGVLFWAGSVAIFNSQSTSFNNRTTISLCLPLPCPFLSLSSGPFCMCSILLPQRLSKALLQRSCDRVLY